MKSKPSILNKSEDLMKIRKKTERNHETGLIAKKENNYTWEKTEKSGQNPETG